MRVILGPIPALEACLAARLPQWLHGYNRSDPDLNRREPGYGGVWPEYVLVIPEDVRYRCVVCFRQAPRLREWDDCATLPDDVWAVICDPQQVGAPRQPHERRRLCTVGLDSEILPAPVLERIADSGPLPRETRRRLLITGYWCLYRSRNTIQVHLVI